MGPPRSTSQPPTSSASSARKRAPNVVGAVAGAVIGGVLGAVVVHKVRQHGGAKRLVPAKVPVLAKRAAGAVKSLAHDAKVVARATAVIAADAALAQVRSAAQQFMVDVASGQPPAPPKLAAPQVSDAPDAAIADQPHIGVPRQSASATSAAKKESAARKKRRAPKTSATPAKARTAR